MRTRWITAVTLCATVSIGGCGTMLRKLDADNTFLVAAVPLEPEKLSACMADATSDIACLAALVGDSREKCTAFVNGLVLHENTANTAFDALTTLLSAAATVTTPLRAAHVLTGGATVSSGWKNSINANIYAKMSIANYAQALDLTYTRDMRRYLDVLGSTRAPVNKPIEIQKIQFIHSECSLALAQGKITTTLEQASQVGETDRFAIVVVRADAPAAVKLTFVRAGGEKLADFDYPVPPGATATSLLGDLAARINGDPILSLTANHVVAVATGTGIEVRAPADLHLAIQNGNENVFKVEKKPTSPSTGP